MVVVVLMGRVRLEMWMMDGLALPLRVALRWKHLLCAFEPFLLFLGLKQKVNLVFGADGSPSFSRDGWKSGVNLSVAGRLRLLFLVDDLMGKDEGMMDILKQLLVRARPASS